MRQWGTAGQRKLPTKQPTAAWHSHPRPPLLRQRGAAMAEFIVVLPALLLLGLGSIQSALFYQAKTTATYATFEAARKGAVNHAAKAPMLDEFGLRVAPIFGGDGGAGKALAAMQKGKTEANDPGITKLEIINPSPEAFQEFGETNPDNGKVEIPNIHLKYRDATNIGSKSGVNIQDANLLKIKTTYGYELKIPMVNTVVTKAMKAIDPDNADYYDQKRIPITAVATVRMQSEAYEDGNLPVTEAPEGDGGVPNDDPGESNPQGGDDPADGQDGNGDDEEEEEEDELECEDTEPEEDNEGAKEEDRGFWGDLWSGIKDGLKEGYEFVKGFWAGIKDQIGDITNLLLHPIDTVKGLIELGKAFYNDPVGTAKMIGEALGQDWSKLVHCGAYDRGKVIGNYANPVFMLKLATKLSKFGDLAQALRQVKADMPCASFAAGTPVVTPQGNISIEAITTGQRVASRNERSFTDAPQPVTTIFGRFVNQYHVLITEDETLRATDTHPLWVQGRGWTEVKEIERGSIIATATGDARVLQNMRRSETLEVHNFGVANTPNYFVGDSQIWAHNASVKCVPGNLRRTGSRSITDQMIDAGIKVPDGWAGHHAIPVAVAQGNDALEYAAKKLGYDINNPNNGIALPTDPDEAKRLGLPVHNGRHTKEYNAYVQAKLDDLNKWWTSGGDDVTETELAERISKIENDIKADLKACRIYCQRRP